MKTNARIAGLFRRTAALTNTNLELSAALQDRECAADLAARQAAAAADMLNESHQLQQHLLDLTRRLLSVDEHEHKQIGGGLQDQLLQTLVGIHIRLLALKKEVTVSSEALNKHIASTRRMVRRSWLGVLDTARAAADKHGN